jgi:uncharacterized protein YqjF (DUF2071 family)
MAEFLTAEWRKLIIVNYQVSRDLLIPYLPANVDLDYYDGDLYVSLVGFLFKNTKIKGFRIPGHINFEEVNLRFYVKRKAPNGEMRRGVVFIKEIVPKKMIVAVANTVYKEHYVAKKMKHKILRDQDIKVSYSWLHDRKWNRMAVVAKSVGRLVEKGSKAHFITDHFWGYTKKNEYVTSEYEVGHPTWKAYDIVGHNIRVDFGANYGREFSFLSEAEPDSVILAEGSEIFVNDGQLIN